MATGVTSRDHARLHRVQAAQLPVAEVEAQLPDRVEFKKYCRWCGCHTDAPGDAVDGARDPQTAPGCASSGR